MTQAELPNPEVYLNYLSPVDARDFEAYRCVTIGILGATIWDILAYIPDDLRILSYSRLRPTMICFILSRLFSVAFILCVTIQTTGSLIGPNATYAAPIFCVLSIGCSTYLFLQRVRAVYADNRRVQWFFSGLWFACTASELVIPLGSEPSSIPGTHYYLVKDRPIVALGVVSGILFGTTVFLAISYKIASRHALVDERISWSTIVSGKALPRVSRAVLQGGQQHYLIVNVTLVTASIMILLPSVYYGVKGVFTLPLVPITASMGCRVFRNLKLLSLNTDATNSGSFYVV